jgi:hypothetical protein
MDVIGSLCVSLGSSTVQLHETAELKLMRGPTRRQSNQSKKVEIVNYYYQWQIVEASGKRQRRTSQFLSKTPNGTEEKATLKGTIGMARFRGSAK